MMWYGVLITLSYNYECFQPPCSCNPATKRTWEQVKVKHKNIIQAGSWGTLAHHEGGRKEKGGKKKREEKREKKGKRREKKKEGIL